VVPLALRRAHEPTTSQAPKARPPQPVPVGLPQAPKVRPPQPVPVGLPQAPALRAPAGPTRVPRVRAEPASAAQSLLVARMPVSAWRVRVQLERPGAQMRLGPQALLEPPRVALPTVATPKLRRRRRWPVTRTTR
jgi:hypothetical protein